jgi:hypothetical protein
MDAEPPDSQVRQADSWMILWPYSRTVGQFAQDFQLFSDVRPQQHRLSLCGHRHLALPRHHQLLRSIPRGQCSTSTNP